MTYTRREQIIAVLHYILRRKNYTASRDQLIRKFYGDFGVDDWNELEQQLIKTNVIDSKEVKKGTIKLTKEIVEKYKEEMKK